MYGYNPNQPPADHYAAAPGYPPAAAAPGYPPAAAAAPGAYDYGQPQYAGGYGAPGAGYGGAGPPRYGPGNRFAAVRLRGLPFGVHEADVNMFLGLDTTDVLMVHKAGRFSGEAFVVLCHPADLDVAMRRNRAYMGNRYIEVFEARKMDYYRAIAEQFAGGERSPGRARSRSPVPRGDGTDGPASFVAALNGSTMLKLRGLPFSATDHDVIQFFEDATMGIMAPAADKVALPAGPDGKPTGLAFVEFETVEQAAAALQKDRAMMGSRYIEVFPSSAAERERYGGS